MKYFHLFTSVISYSILDNLCDQYLPSFVARIPNTVSNVVSEETQIYLLIYISLNECVEHWVK